MKRIRSRRWITKAGHLFVEEIDMSSGRVHCIMFHKYSRQSRHWEG